jgi:hypothetical protein
MECRQAKESRVSAEHKRPLYAFVMVAMLCAFLMLGSVVRADNPDGLFKPAVPIAGPDFQAPVSASLPIAEVFESDEPDVVSGTALLAPAFLGDSGRSSADWINSFTQAATFPASSSGASNPGQGSGSVSGAPDQSGQPDKSDQPDKPGASASPKADRKTDKAEERKQRKADKAEERKQRKADKAEERKQRKAVKAEERKQRKADQAAANPGKPDRAAANPGKGQGHGR